MSREKLILYMLLLVPVVSSVLSTIHIISLTSLGNPIVLAIATAVTYEISSIVSFISSSTSSANISKARLYFIFVVLFILQCMGNTYSGFHYINGEISSDSGYLSDIMEMTFNILKPAELKLALSALIGIPLPLISLIMLKSALEFSESVGKNTAVYEEQNVEQDSASSEDDIEESVGDTADENIIEQEPVHTVEISKPATASNPVSNKKPVKSTINKKVGSIDRDPSDKNIV